MIRIESEKAGKISRITIEGKFVIDEVQKFESEYMKLLKLNLSVIAIDLSSTDYIDSSAVGALIKFMNATKNAEISIYLYNMNASIRHIFKLAFIDRFFNITTAEELEEKYPDFNWKGASKS